MERFGQVLCAALMIIATAMPVAAAAPGSQPALPSVVLADASTESTDLSETDIGTFCEFLHEFIAYVQALVSFGVISPEDGAKYIEGAIKIRAFLGCP